MIGQKNFDFSFAGLKTALLYKLKGSDKADWKEINRRAITGRSENLAPVSRQTPLQATSKR
jgi:tRNA A37 threonylcarbamoyltransferase TsaD